MHGGCAAVSRPGRSYGLERAAVCGFPLHLCFGKPPVRRLPAGKVGTLRAIEEIGEPGRRRGARIDVRRFGRVIRTWDVYLCLHYRTLPL